MPLQGQVGRQVDGAFELDPLVALLATGAQDGSAPARRDHRLIVEVDEEGGEVELGQFVEHVALHADHQAALRLGLQQAAAFGLGLGVGAEVDLGGLERVAHAGVQRRFAEQAVPGFPGAPLGTHRTAQAIDVLVRRCRCRDASAVEPRLGTGLVRPVPAQSDQETGIGCRRVAPLCVRAEETTVVVEVEAALLREPVDVRDRIVAVQAEFRSVATAVDVGASEQHVDPGRQVHEGQGSHRDVTVDEQFVQVLCLPERLEIRAGVRRPRRWRIAGVDEAARALGVCLRQGDRVAPAPEGQRQVVSEHDLVAIGIELRVRGVLVEVDRQQRGELSRHRVGREGAARLLPQSQQIHVDSRGARPDRRGESPAPLRAPVAGACVGQLIVAQFGADRLADVPGGQHRGPRHADRAVASVAHVEHAFRASGRIVDHVDGAGERGGSEVHGGASPKHFDPLDVDEADRLELRDEGAARGNAVDQQQQVVDLAHAEQARHRGGRTGVPAGCHGHATEQGERRAQIGRAAFAHLGARDDSDRTGHFLDRLAEAGCGDLHGLEHRRRRRGGLGERRRCRAAEQERGDGEVD